MAGERENGRMKTSQEQDTRWYVLYTMSNAEKQVELRLRKRLIETFLPLHLSPRKWSDRIKLVEIPIFSSYIFVKTTDNELRSLLTIPGISRIVFYNGSPAILKNTEILKIKSFLEKARTYDIVFHTNEDVLIACGPLKDMSGIIKKVTKKQIVLHLEQLGIIVSVSPDQVLKKQMA